MEYDIFFSDPHKDAEFGNNENFKVDISPMADGSMMITVQEWLSMQARKQ